jgi:glutamine amidotransferase
MIAVVDYGIGNLRSAEKALQHVGADARLVADPDDVVAADGVVLPGVGAFGSCAAALRNGGFEAAVGDVVRRGVPFLGICIGFQLLFEGSDEDASARGLGLVPGWVRSLSPAERLPQMQWNLVQPVGDRSSRLLGIGADGAGPAPKWFYFVHSYAPVPSGEAEAGVVGRCDYGGDVVAAYERGSLFGTQFHPEKSGTTGLELLGRFASLCGGG